MVLGFFFWCIAVVTGSNSYCCIKYTHLFLLNTQHFHISTRYHDFLFFGLRYCHILYFGVLVVLATLTSRTHGWFLGPLLKNAPDFCVTKYHRAFLYNFFFTSSMFLFLFLIFLLFLLLLLPICHNSLLYLLLFLLFFFFFNYLYFLFYSYSTSLFPFTFQPTCSSLISNFHLTLFFLYLSCFSSVPCSLFIENPVCL